MLLNQGVDNDSCTTRPPNLFSVVHCATVTVYCCRLSTDPRSSPISSDNTAMFADLTALICVHAEDASVL